VVKRVEVSSRGVVDSVVGFDGCRYGLTRGGKRGERGGVLGCSLSV